MFYVISWSTFFRHIIAILRFNESVQRGAKRTKDGRGGYYKVAIFSSFRQLCNSYSILYWSTLEDIQ